MKLLMVTSRNIDRNGGENALIVGRHTALYKCFGVRTDIVFLHKDTKEHPDCYPGMSFLECKKDDLFRLVEELLNSGAYQGVVFSGSYDKSFNRYIQKKKQEMELSFIVDIHATIREVYEFCIPDLYHRLGTRYLYLLKRRRFKEALQIADYAFIVSDEELIEVNAVAPKNEIKAIKVKCGCYSEFDSSEYLHIRGEERAKLEIDNETLAFVYAGSRDRWQKYQETVDLFKRIKDSGVKCKFAFYAQLDEGSVRELRESLGPNNVVVRWVPPEVMKRELMAYDVGVMLRDKCWTNRVAFPNKFSDYISSGLVLALSDAVVEPYKLIKKYDMPVFDELDVPSSLRAIAELRTEGLDSYLKLCRELVNKELVYDAQVSEEAGCLAEELRRIASAR